MHHRDESRRRSRRRLGAASGDCMLRKLAMVVSLNMEARSACAILLNPCLDEERSTAYAVLRIVAEQREWEKIEVANLFSVRTRNSKELALTQLNRSHVLATRPRVEDLLACCTDLIFAWGVSLLPGKQRHLQREQIEWIISRAAFYGHECAWMMGGTTRHPSRWRQYVGPQRAVVAGLSTAQRLDRALICCPIWEASKE